MIICVSASRRLIGDSALSVVRESESDYCDLVPEKVRLHSDQDI